MPVPTADAPTPVPAADLGNEGPPEGPISSKISEEAASTSEEAALTAEVAASTGGGAAADVLPEPGSGPVAGEGDAGGVPEKRGRRRSAPEPAPELYDAELRGALEAILLVVDEPVSELTLADVLEQPVERIGPMLDEIAAGYTAAGHGFELRRAAGGWRLYTRPEYAAYVERFVLDGQSVRLTQAALETLAVVAYKQPVTRSRISAIRGVNCDGVIRTLVSRGLVEECGTEPDSGAFLYRTTTMFLEKLGLNSLDDLPPLAPFLPDDVEELADATR
ncbi:SMC-Scp complex subunit ScpB [Micromonospora echinaurantiaca]|uniref:SMC-Scp complex subunit ScpB n=1 Tax=Micromonospora echinaurantiaca TaxID=47857 RepID=UPI0037BCDF6B